MGCGYRFAVAACAAINYFHFLSSVSMYECMLEYLPSISIYIFEKYSIL